MLVHTIVILSIVFLQVGSMSVGQSWKNNNDSIKSFEYSEDLSYGKTKGLLTHGQVRKDKSDVFPQIELIEMLKSI